MHRCWGWRSSQPMATADVCNNLHFLCRQIELVGIFFFRKMYNNRNLSLPDPFCKLQKQTAMIVNIPLNPGCTDSRMDEHPVCSPASVAPSKAKEERNKIM